MAKWAQARAAGMKPERSLSRHPLFQVMLAHLRAGSARATAAGVDLAFEEVDTGTSKFDLSVWVRETAGVPVSEPRRRA